jgi:predicted RNA-binding Zn ribbon-like protein
MSREADRFYFVGERLCVDFVNTEIVEGGDRVDLLRSYDDLMEWYAAAQVLSASEARTLAGRSGKADALRTLQQALRFRATLREMLEQLAGGRTNLPQETLDEINQILALGTSDREVVRTKRGYETRLRRGFTAPDQLLVPLAESAVDLLTNGDLTLVKRCQNPQCILFFYDTTKNHGRRWCSMAACGNRAKVAAHYHRARGNRLTRGSSPRSRPAP